MRDQDNLIIMEKLDSLPSETHIDVLIMAASVDKRCYAVFEKFLTNCITIDRIVILDYAKTRPMPKSSEYSEYYKLNSYPNVEQKHLFRLLTVKCCYFNDLSSSKMWLKGQKCR